ncbi:MAG: phosphopantetheine-binding protein [Polyangiales bacterium]
MNVGTLKVELKSLIVRELNLEGRDPASIEDSAPLFGEGLGLDSLDALQLAMSIEEKYAVRIPEGPEGRTAFASVTALAEWILAHPGEKRPSGTPG